MASQLYDSDARAASNKPLTREEMKPLLQGCLRNASTLRPIARATPSPDSNWSWRKAVRSVAMG
jgi:hypothetical protein